MIRLSEDLTCCKCAKRMLALLVSLLLLAGGIFSAFTEKADAAAQTVTLKYGKSEAYGNGGTYIKWITHIDGEAIDLDEIPGVSRSYAYCVQPLKDDPGEGVHTVTLVDDDDTGKISTMRKLIYYLPGSYGYKKVTKKRWFEDNQTGASAYVIGHLGLSWIYSNYSEGDEVWVGSGSALKKKVKAIVNDLKNLADPPESFEVFWIKVKGKQDVFGAFYAVEYGKLRLLKQSANPNITSNNNCYSFEGGQYALFEDAECTKMAKTKSGKDAVMNLNEDGSSNEVEVEAGNYYIKETIAPRGYALDSAIKPIEVVEEKTSTFTALDIPKSNSVNLLIQKLDKETGQARPQGAASLEGAEYTIKYYDVTPSSNMSEAEMAAAIASRSPAMVNGKEAVWVFRTDENGKIDMSKPDRYLISERSADYYYNSSGQAALPIGIISVSETAAPKGYLLDKTVRYAAIQDAGTEEHLSTLKTFTEDNGLKEQVVRGDLRLSKAAEGRERMEGVAFGFTSLSNGEKHVLVCDKNGMLCSAASWTPHDEGTNEGRSSSDGIWFNGYNDENIGAKPDNSLGALPYDTYLMEEIRSDANKGYELICDEVTIERAGVTLDLGTYDDAKEPVPSLETRARDAVTNTSGAFPSKNMLIIDSVDYYNVRPGKKYEISGILMDKKTGKALLDDNGNEILGSTEFFADKETGNVEVEFRFSGESLGGKSAVVFESLKLDGATLAEHNDINNTAQTIIITSENPPEPEEPEEPEEPREPPKTETPDTGDIPAGKIIYYLISILAPAEMMLLTAKRRNDRLN